MSWISTAMNWLSPIISGGISAVGQHSANQANRDIANQTNQANRDIAAMTNAANAQQVREQMKFQERMSNTAYQRQMADLKKAGVNPMLVASLGGSSTPPGASIPAVAGAPQTTGAPMQNELAGVSQSAMDAVRLRQELSNMRSQETNVKSSTALNEALREAALSDSKLKANSAKVADMNSRLLRYSLPAAKTEAEIDDSVFGRAMRYVNRAIAPVSGLASTAKSVREAVRPTQHRRVTYVNKRSKPEVSRNEPIKWRYLE